MVPFVLSTARTRTCGLSPKNRRLQGGLWEIRFERSWCSVVVRPPSPWVVGMAHELVRYMWSCRDGTGTRILNDWSSMER